MQNIHLKNLVKTIEHKNTNKCFFNSDLNNEKANFLKNSTYYDIDYYQGQDFTNINTLLSQSLTGNFPIKNYASSG